MKRKVPPRAIGNRRDEILVELSADDLVKLPEAFLTQDEAAPVPQLSPEQIKRYECSLDGVCALGIPRPQSQEEEKRLVQAFLNGLQKLMSRSDNWMFWQPLLHSLEDCARCHLCADACPIYVASGRQEVYSPAYRSEVLRRLANRYLKKGGVRFAALLGNDVELNWVTVSRLGELAYRCTLCRRCAQACPRGVDNGLISHEIRKLFSQEMGLAPRELHEMGTVRHLNTGASTGMTPKAFKGIVQFMEDEIADKIGRRIKIPVDKEGADILLIHNSGEFLSWPENPEAFAIVFDAVGLNWTMSSQLYGYEATNYGIWYDDIQFARIALRQMEAARELKVKRVVVGECGHAHKAMVVLADRLLPAEKLVPRESYLPLLDSLVASGKLKLDPQKNSFPVTLHDPCNIVRQMGIVEPQRRILRRICPQFREMEPHGVENYCCGGGSGFAIMNSFNFPAWRNSVSGRMKLKQILEAFEDARKEEKKYVCAPCSNCKGQLRDLFAYYKVTERCGIYAGGLVELVVNAMEDAEGQFIAFETG